MTQNPLQLFDMQFAERRAEFQAILPSNCTFEKFARIVKTAAIQNHEILNADRKSLFMSCHKAAQDGLLPDGREAALVVYNIKQKDNTYKKMVQYMPMLAGVLKKVRNSGELTTIYAQVVYEADEFDYILGDSETIIHRPFIEGDRGKAIAVYAIAHTKDGGIYREVMNFAEIERIRSFSKNKDGLTWTEHWSEMAKKTAIRRLAKRLPMSTDLEQIIQRDDETLELKPKIVNSPIDDINKQIIDNARKDKDSSIVTS